LLECELLLLEWLSESSSEFLLELSPLKCEIIFSTSEESWSDEWLSESRLSESESSPELWPDDELEVSLSLLGAVELSEVVLSELELLEVELFE
jgi:hypothetical protein